MAFSPCSLTLGALHRYAGAAVPRRLLGSLSASPAYRSCRARRGSYRDNGCCGGWRGSGGGGAGRACTGTSAIGCAGLAASGREPRRSNVCAWSLDKRLIGAAIPRAAQRRAASALPGTDRLRRAVGPACAPSRNRRAPPTARSAASRASHDTASTGGSGNRDNGDTLGAGTPSSPYHTATDPHKRFATLEELHATLRALHDDPLAHDGGRIVLYRGCADAKLMIIGEAPGAEEDRLGEPFVGKAGALLDRILRSVHFDPQRDVYVTNVVKRRPPSNRDPNVRELDYYRPFVAEEIRLQNPALIMLTGRMSMRTVLGERAAITKVRGTWYERSTRLIMPVFHPAYLLRNPSREAGSPKSLMWRDIQEVRRRYDEICG